MLDPKTNSSALRAAMSLALDDQQLGGLVMWVPGGIAYLVAGLAIAVAWRGSRTATGSDDLELFRFVAPVLASTLRYRIAQQSLRIVANVDERYRRRKVSDFLSGFGAV